MPAASEPSASAPSLREAPAWVAWEWAAVGGLLLLALALRLHDYTLAPTFTDNADEVQFTWAGMNLLLHGDPYTWELPGLGYLGQVPFAAFGTHYYLTHHWLAHPPLFSLVMGSWAVLLGDRSLDQTTAAQVRIPPILFSCLAVFLAYLLGRRVLGRPAALLGASLLAVAPAAVLLGREPETESLLALLLLAALLLSLRFAGGAGGRWTFLALCACAVAAPLVKL
ncbi:MAG: glycosyltransferase family 39 protein, partial [Candidatus Dormibacteraeota bacterium]|nr:glycosyltransferase family 39 protein [Candidatus Dormibacteraeota bacterium]